MTYGSRVSLDVRINLPQTEHLITGQKTGLFPSSVENGTSVSLRQHEAVRIRRLRLCDVVLHLMEEEASNDLG